MHIHRHCRRRLCRKDQGCIGRFGAGGYKYTACNLCCPGLCNRKYQSCPSRMRRRIGKSTRGYMLFLFVADRCCLHRHTSRLPPTARLTPCQVVLFFSFFYWFLGFFLEADLAIHAMATIKLTPKIAMAAVCDRFDLVFMPISWSNAIWLASVAACSKPLEE